MSIYYNRNVLEAKARRIISQYDPLLLSNPAPVPVEDMMEEVYGLSIEYQFIRSNGRVLGETIFEDCVIPIYERGSGNGYKLIHVKAGTVIIDAGLLNDRNDGRLRYTCAHELSHWVLHKELYSKSGETAAMTKTVRSSEEDKIIERQADILSSYILMPKGAVKTAFHRCAAPQSEKVTAIARLFRVLKQAAQIRLEEMGLLR